MIMALLCGGASALTACPYISEVHADPDLFPDGEGEFLEVVVPARAMAADSLFIHQDGKMIARSGLEPGARIVFCHPDSIRLIPENPVACTPLLTSLVNSRPLELILTSTNCRDTSIMEAALPGKSWQLDSSGIWGKSDPSPGFAALGFESGLRNATWNVHSANYDVNRWEIEISTQASHWNAEWIPLNASIGMVQKGQGNGLFTIQQPGGQLPWTRLRLTLYSDDYPLDNHLDTLLFPSEKPPIRISEVKPDPEDRWPEWIEVENESPVDIPIAAISACIPMAEYDSSAVLSPGFHAILTDSREQLLEAAPGLAQSTILQTKQSWSLGNSADTVRICLWNTQVDSLYWNKQKPLPYLGESPGWRPQEYSKDSIPKIARRTLSRSRWDSSFRIQLPISGRPWRASVWNRLGDAVVAAHTVEEGEFRWKPDPAIALGAYQISLQSASGKKHILGVTIAP
jgi:hypothetical protein